MRRGELIGERFELQQLAGRGGMGEVYRAIDRTTGQPVAVKVLRGSQGSDIARFEREARILSELDNPLVVRYIAHGALLSGEPYLVMEWLDGEDLASRLARQRLSPADSLTLAITVAEALGILHDRGIVHRDLKPGNIFLLEARIDRIKLLDFGLARIQESTRMTQTGAMLGTMAYMAPEQARGAAELDSAADIFALGCVLFECLTSEQAFSAAHPTAVLTKILFEEPPRLSDKLAGAPPALDALVARMLSKQPDDRPCNGRAAAESLRALWELGLALVGVEPTVELPRPSMLTGSEQRAAAVILLGALADRAALESGDVELELEAAAHGGTFERLIDGTAAVLLSSSQVATDLAAQAARCAIGLGRHAPGRRIALAMGRSHLGGRLPVGPAIDKATRLLGGSAPPDSDALQAVITLDEAAVGLLDARFDVCDESGVFLLRGERDIAEVRTLLGKPTPCVGRERDLQILEQLFDECASDGAAQAVLVTALPGVGKSRLGRELLQSVPQRHHAAAIWIGRADSLRAGSALSLLGQALRSACGVRDGEPLDARREKLRARVAELVPEADRKRITEFVGEIIGTPFRDEDSLPLRAARRDAQLMNDQMRAAFVDFLAAECTRNPVLILLEDLHWGDSPTVQYLERGLRDLGEKPLFVLALARPEVHDLFPGLWARCRMYEIRLKELNRKAIERLVRHVLGDKARPETLEQLARLSEGNAFYLEELIRWAAEGQGDHLPETVVAMVQSRLGALDDESRRLLRAASIFGEVCWAGSVAALLGGAEHTTPVRERLSLLVDQELLVKRKQSRFPDQEEYAFRHALLREGAYGMLTADDLSLRHKLAGEWLEAHGEQDALLLAEHFEKGGEGERAGHHYLRAVEHANYTSDSPAAIACARRGLACGVSDALRIRLLGGLCENHYFHVDLVAAALPQARELVQMAPRASVPWVQGMLIVHICALQAGQIDEFLTVLHDLLNVDPSIDTAGPLALALAVGVILLDHIGRIRNADLVLDQMAAIAHAYGDAVPLASALRHAIFTIRAASAMEDPAAGLSHAGATLAIADAIGHWRYRYGAQVMASMNRWFLGQTAEIAPTLENATLPDEELGYASSHRSFILAWVLAERGALSEARQWATRLITSGQSRRTPIDEGRGHWVLAEVLRRAGEFETAEAEIQTALAMLGMACPLDVPGALATLAALRLAQGRPAEALAAAEEGLMKYESMGACTYFFRGAFLRLVHAECLGATGHHDAAKAAIAKAKERLFTIAGKIADPAYRKTFLEHVPENRRTLELARQWLREQD